MGRHSTGKHTITTLRKVAGLTQQQLADMAGCIRLTIQSIETGRDGKKLSVDLARRIAAQTGIDPNWLLKGDPTGTPMAVSGKEFTLKEYEAYRAYRLAEPASPEEVTRFIKAAKGRRVTYKMTLRAPKPRQADADIWASMMDELPATAIVMDPMTMEEIKPPMGFDLLAIGKALKLADDRDVALLTFDKLLRRFQETGWKVTFHTDWKRLLWVMERMLKDFESSNKLPDRKVDEHVVSWFEHRLKYWKEEIKNGGPIVQVYPKGKPVEREPKNTKKRSGSTAKKTSKKTNRK